VIITIYGRITLDSTPFNRGALVIITIYEDPLCNRTVNPNPNPVLGVLYEEIGQHLKAEECFSEIIQLG
jgi:hypothetical protein